MNKKIECLTRLLDADMFYEFSEWLTDVKLSSTDTFTNISSNHERAEIIFTILTKAHKSGKLLLLDFEWVILPIEQIKVTCVTLSLVKEFIYSA